MEQDEVASCFVSKLEHFFSLTPRERDAIAGFERNERRISAGEVVYREGDPSSELFIVKRGWLYSCRYLQNGQRQVVQIRHPGDLCGMHDLILAARSTTLIALEECVICPLPQQALRQLVDKAPRVQMLIHGIAALDQVLLVDVLQAIARTSASERVLHLLLNVYHRLRLTNNGLSNEFRLPVTQSLIGDMMGLTNVSVSKSMRVLEEAGMIQRTRGTVTLLNLEHAIDRIDYQDRFTNLELGWMQ